MADEAFLRVRSLAVDYLRGSHEARHAHPWGQLLFAARGTLRAVIDRDVWILPPSRALWIPAGIAHALVMPGPVMLRTLWFRVPPWPVDGTGVRVFEVSRLTWNTKCSMPGSAGLRAVASLLDEAILRTCELHWLDERRAFDRVLADLMAAELAEAPSRRLCLPMPEDPRARRLAESWLEGDEPGDPAGSFSRLGLSRRTAERLFHKETGLSPGRFRQLTRLIRGLAALSAGATVSEASQVSGYGSRSGFHDAFKGVFGVASVTMSSGHPEHSGR